MVLHLLCSVAAVGAVALPVSEEVNPVADSSAVVVSGNARFTVLTPELIRMEYAAGAEFEDRASFVFTNRRLPVPEFSVDRAEGQLVIGTAALTLRYVDGDEPFNKGNLSVELVLNGKPTLWKPGQPDVGNLGGTYRTLDMVSGDVALPPGLLSRDGWTVVDDSERLLFDKHEDTDWPWAAPRDKSGVIDWYFFGYGHDYARALRDFTRVAGRIPLPPRFAFGSWWSRYWAYSDTELKELVAEFAEHDVPLDVLVIDMDWHLDGWTGYTWNPKYFPDPDGFLRWVREQGLRVTLNLHPADGVKKHEKGFADVAEAMGLDPTKVEEVPFDCADPRYVDAYFKHLHHPLERQGVDFWWIDWQQGEKTKIEGLDPLWWLNYLHWTDMERNPELKGKRPLLFSRWGKLGNHRYQVGFSGDTYCNWPSLAFQPYFTSTAGNVCYPYWSHDIGGHQPGPVDPELYARWIQWGIFSPILRTHTTKNPAAERRIWKFPDQVFHAAREAFHLRYELIPYIYTAARQCYDTALPICRPLYYAWPELDEAYTHTNEYMFGDDLLVSPVVKPASPLSGCAELRVWLPPGEWVNWYTGRRYDGNATVSLQVPLNEIPLFVRAGAIIPAQPKMSRTGAKPANPLILHVWPGTGGETRVYEDDGETTAYQHGTGAWTPVANVMTKSIRTITVGPVESTYPSMPAKRAIEIRLHDVWAPAKVRVSGRDRPLPRLDKPGPEGWYYDATTVSATIRLSAVPTGQAVEVAIEPARSAPSETLLSGGLRGQLRRLAAAAEFVRQDHPVLPAAMNMLYSRITKAGVDPARVSSEMGRLGEQLLAALRRAEHDKVEARRVLMRLLGLQCHIDVRGAGDGGNAIDVSGVVAVSPTPELLGSASGRLELLPPPNWKVNGKSEWTSADLAAEGRIPVSTVLASDGPPQTTILESKFTLESGNVRIDVPTRTVLLPSIGRWWVAGPFSAKPPDGLGQVFPPEQGIDLKATYPASNGKPIAWQRIERPLTPNIDLTDEFFVNFIEVFEQHNDAVAYALTYLHAAEETDATLAFGTDDGVAIWLNGEEIHRQEIGRAYVSKDDSIPVRLKQGANPLLVKISQGGGGWGFCVHVETPDGSPLPEVTALLNP